MPDILIKTKNPATISQLRKYKKPGYEVVPVDMEETFSNLSQDNKNVHGIVVDCDLITPMQVGMIKENMGDDMFPVVLLSESANQMSEPEAGQWIGYGVSDIFQLPMPAPIMSRRLGAAIQLYCVTQHLHGQGKDRLTGLYNRGAFYHFAREMMNDGPEDEYMVILSDIENFKRINETFGETKGDELLRFVGKSLSSMNNENVLFARYGGDQFVGILRMPKEDIPVDENFIQLSMEHMYASAPVDHFTVQFGVYEKVDKTLPISILCDRAMMALKTIKHQYGRNVGKYTLQLQQQHIREQQILDSMENALNDGQFKVYYQPKHDIATSRIVGAEALVRWNHPVFGFMSPGEFIPLFERSGFIREMDNYVWGQTCLDVKKMINKGIPIVPVSINVSRKDLIPEMIKYVRRPLDTLDLDPKNFHLELTETLYIEDAEHVSPIIDQLKELGIKIEIDDFGSGFSSLGILSKFPVDIIKLDITLIRDIEKQPAIVDSVIHLMHTLGYKVTAEGVENDSQVELLRKMGCDYVQGYYYSKPLTFEGFCELLINQE